MPLVKSSRMPHIYHKGPICDNHIFKFGAHATAIPIGHNHQNQLLCQRAVSLRNSNHLKGAPTDIFASHSPLATMVERSKAVVMVDNDFPSSYYIRVLVSSKLARFLL